ncbi:MAG: hypothetical protein P0S95_08280 [Rhabdochlamydiaceae bacterium]|nr:hypothetical protein [Candidatus Amphrikana amoebophyrae]
MRKWIVTLVFFGFFSLGFCSNHIRQSITIGVGPINELSFSIGEICLYLERDGLQKRYEKDDFSTFYSIMTNEDAKKIVAYIDDILPSGIDLFVKLDPPAGAYNTGFTVLEPFPKDVVVNINRVQGNMLQVSYKLSSNDQAIEMKPQNKTVTYLLVDM